MSRQPTIAIAITNAPKADQVVKAVIRTIARTR